MSEFLLRFSSRNRQKAGVSLSHDFVDQQVQARTGTTGLTQRAYFIQAVGHVSYTHHTHTLACATVVIGAHIGSNQSGASISH